MTPRELKLNVISNEISKDVKKAIRRFRSSRYPNATVTDKFVIKALSTLLNKKVQRYVRKNPN